MILLNSVYEYLNEKIKENFMEDGSYCKYMEVESKSEIEDPKEVDIEEYVDELMTNLKANNLIKTWMTNITYAFDSPGYSCDVLSISWIEADGHLCGETYLIERK